MGKMAWVRVDVGIGRNPKILELLELSGGERAFISYLFGLGYVAEQGTNGFIPHRALGAVRGSHRSVQLLLQVGLWHECAGGWDVNDYAEYQPAEMSAKARSDRARKAAEARWKTD
jgi:hypothetical protein